jgi:RNA polymerase sigma-70 factor, ECF subfamily
MFESEDSRLIAQVRGGNLEAFARLYEKYKGQVYRTALAITRDREAAEDILQDCFLRTHAHMNTLNGENSIAPWLYRVTVNLCYNWLARGRRQVTSWDDILGHLIGSRSPSPHRLAEAWELRSVILRAIDELSFDHRIVVLLYYLNDFNLDEIAYILECPVGTVKSRLFYAREKLKQRLATDEVALGGLLTA